MQIQDGAAGLQYSPRLLSPSFLSCQHPLAPPKQAGTHRERVKKQAERMAGLSAILDKKEPGVPFVALETPADSL